MGGLPRPGDARAAELRLLLLARALPHAAPAAARARRAAARLAPPVEGQRSLLHVPSLVEVPCLSSLPWPPGRTLARLPAAPLNRGEIRCATQARS